MRAFVLVAALAVVAVNAHPAKEEKDGLPVVHGYKHGDPCPAKDFYNDCNRCFCLPDGHSAGCTAMFCTETEHNVEKRSVDVASYPHNDIFSLTRECIPNQIFVDRCNICHCVDDGKQAGCTKMACPPVEKVHIDGYRQGMKCLPGETFYDECNSCQCGSDGVSAGCTLIACPGSPSRVARSVSASANLPHIDNFWEIGECTPGQSFIDVCNTCVCAKDGTQAACTKIACPPVDIPRIDGYQQGKKCPAGKTFRDRCNTCHCGANGNSALCTLIACQE